MKKNLQKIAQLENYTEVTIDRFNSNLERVNYEL